MTGEGLLRMTYAECRVEASASQEPRKRDIAPKQGGESRRRKKDTERNQRRLEGGATATERELGLFAVPALADASHGIHDEEERHRAKQRGREDGNDRARRSERGAGEGHQGHVPHSHRFALERHFAEPTDDRDEARTGARTDEGIVRTSERSIRLRRRV